MKDNSLTYKGFIGSLEVSLDDNCLFGKLLHIDDLVTYEGSTPEELSSAFRSAVDDYIRVCKEEDREPNKPFKGSLNVRIGEDLHKAAALLSLEIGTTLNDLIKEAVRDRVCRGKNNGVIIHEHVTAHRFIESALPDSRYGRFETEDQAWSHVPQ